MGKAQFCFKWACSLNLDDSGILREIGLQYMRAGCFQLALAALSRALALEEDAHTLVLLGDVNGALNQASGLIENYEKAYDLLEKGEEEGELKVAVAKRIVTALMALGREDEARRYLQ